MESNVLIELSPFEILTKMLSEETRKYRINNWQANTPTTTLLKKPLKPLELLSLMEMCQITVSLF